MGGRLDSFTSNTEALCNVTECMPRMPRMPCKHYLDLTDLTQRKTSCAARLKKERTTVQKGGMPLGTMRPQRPEFKAGLLLMCGHYKLQIAAGFSQGVTQFLDLGNAICQLCRRSFAHSNRSPSQDIDPFIFIHLQDKTCDGGAAAWASPCLLVSA